ncbi:MAG: hypothetical protein JXA90_02160 [Planctomycetes bacterium]|nr:hypothetical protein [Planctomycetota bacterium]
MGRGKKRRKDRGKPPSSPYRELSDEALGATLSELLAAGNYRRSLEVTREIRRRGLLPSYRDLAARAYEMRALELAANRLFDESAITIAGAVEFDLATPPMMDVALRCALGTGRSEMLLRAIGSAAVEREIEEQLLADLAILGAPSSAPRSAPAMRPPTELSGPLAAGVRSILRAFEHYEHGRHLEARQELAAIGRRSPLAGWRWILRGLMARAEDDLEGARRAWKAVQLRGASAILAKELLESLAPAETTAEADARAAAGAQGTTPGIDHGALKLDLAAQDPRVRLLEEIRERLREVARDEDPSAEERLIASVRRLLQAWPGGLAPDDRSRLFRSIIGDRLLSSDAHDELARRLGPLCEDPDGLAHAATHMEEEDSEQAHELWVEYIGRFPRRLDLSTQQVRQAKAILWERVGDVARDCWKQGQAMGCPCPICRRRRRKYEDVVEPGALDAYTKSLALDPEAIGVWRKLAELYEQARRPKDAERALLDLSERFPQNVDSLLRLGEICFARKAYRKAFGYFEKARALEPLNARVLEKLADCRVESAWGRARKGRLDLARKDLAEAERIQGGRLSAPHRIRWAAVERAGGESSCADEVIKKAVAAGMWELEAKLRLSLALRQLGRREEADAEACELRRQIEKLPRRAEIVEPAANLYHLFSEDGESAKDGGGRLEESIRKSFRGFLRAVCSLKLPDPQRLSLCHIFHACDDPLLVIAYAEEGRKQFPKLYSFSLLEAEARIKRGETLPRKLRKALERGRQQAMREGDEESAEAMERILFACGGGAGRFPDVDAGALQWMIEMLGRELGVYAEYDEDDEEKDEDEDDEDDEEPRPPRSEAAGGGGRPAAWRGRGRRPEPAKTRSARSGFTQRWFDFF